MKKRCCHCKQTFDNSYFSKDISTSDGYCARCKICQSERSKIYRIKNRNHLIEKTREYFKKNKKEILQKQRIYYRNNKEKIIEKNTAYKATERGKEVDRKYDQSNKGKARAHRTYLKHRGKIITAAVEYVRNHKDAHNRRVREWSKTIGGQTSAKAHYASRRGAGRVSKDSIKEIVLKNTAEYGVLTCVYCKTPITEKYHIDHMVPVCRGGLSIVKNLTVACPPCNMRKHAKTLEEFVAYESQTA